MDQKFTATSYQIIGDSYAAFLKRAAARTLPRIKDARWPLDSVTPLGPAILFFAPFHHREGQVVRITNTEIRENAASLWTADGELIWPKEKMYFLSLGMHTQSFLYGRRWAQHSHWQTEAALTRHRLSDASFAAMVRDINSHLIDFVSDLRDLGYQLAILSSPPPTRRFALFEMGYSARDVLFLDGRYREVMQQEFSRLGVPIVTPPDGVTEDGFLREEYLVSDLKDRHHGNIDYSILMLSKIAACCGFCL